MRPPRRLAPLAALLLAGAAFAGCVNDDEPEEARDVGANASEDCPPGTTTEGGADEAGACPGPTGDAGELGDASNAS